MPGGHRRGRGATRTSAGCQGGPTAKDTSSEEEEEKPLVGTPFKHFNGNSIHCPKRHAAKRPTVGKKEEYAEHSNCQAATFLKGCSVGQKSQMTRSHDDPFHS